MQQHFENHRKEFIERIINYVSEKMPDEGLNELKDFIQQYYLSISPEDLMDKSILDIYGALVSHWNFIKKKQPGEFKVRVFNPQLEQDGWQSSHTIIEIICDNMPFIVDSLRMALNRLELEIHLMIHMGSMSIQRDTSGVLTNIFCNEEISKGNQEIPVYIEIDKQSDQEILSQITNKLSGVLSDVKIVVQDWHPMREKATQAIEVLKNCTFRSSKDVLEVVELLEWYLKNNFTFLGYREYKFNNDQDNPSFNLVPGTGLGVLRDEISPNERREFAKMAPSARQEYLSDNLITIGKTATKATVHRPTNSDFWSIPLRNEKNQLIGEMRFIGLYTASAYNISPLRIPYIRNKVDNVVHESGFLPGTHDHKSLLNIISNLPRDELFQASINDLAKITLGIFHMQERLKLRLFIRKDIFGRYYSCLVYVPREQFNSELRQQISYILIESLGGHSVTFVTSISESVLARIHFMVRVDPLVSIDYEIEKIEAKLIEASRTWRDDLKDALVEYCGEEQTSEILKRYGNAFPASYRETFSARSAVVDIERIETLRYSDDDSLAMSLYRPIEDPEDSFRFKLYRLNKPISLSNVVPMLENLGLIVISERPYQIRRKGNGTVWINDYRMIFPANHMIRPDMVKDIFQSAFAAIWRQSVENDGFNKLVLLAQLNDRQVSILRAYYKYMWQTGFGISQKSVEEALCTYPEIAKSLVKLFHKKFDPETTTTEAQISELESQIIQSLESVKSLNDDRIIRRYVGNIKATLRTNAFQVDVKKQHKPYLSFKFDSGKVPELPLPKPMFEVFVYSPIMEGIHLRGAKVARGGLRWSDRLEDYRTEVLGLMKAQQVKNAVIVPLGAKGGFVVKENIEQLDRESRTKKVVACYQDFICGLLDITDNKKGDKVIPPPNVVSYDDADPYLVVAADKGTATFSDIANELSANYDFWLGDAFASGGSQGYDHKKMGITAKGAWESVKMHFQHLGHNTQTTPFTVIGIGDMSGDVFGNGMLLSQHIKLLAAFNHLHIFVDPNPQDCLKSFEERQRLFQMPRSNWQDYKKELISEGGGIFWRSAKSIHITPQMKTVFGIEADNLVPNELIKAILCAKADLLWNGGIGTYVKASSETHADADDRNNDVVRINANDLQCKVIGEGGNLGLTQLARVEYAKLGGIINTDAIDNSAGVNCSDNEVNIKILLNAVVEQGDLTEKQRNELLVSMTEEVTEMVLENNRRQNTAISVAASQAAKDLQMHDRIMNFLEREANLDREIEFLPAKEEIQQRKTAEIGLTRPEIAVVLAYVKNKLKQDILNSTIPEDEFFQTNLFQAFPNVLRQKYEKFIVSHKLSREIISTQLSNRVVDEMGIAFVSRLQEEAGADTPSIMKAYMVASNIFNQDSLREEINDSQDKISIDVLMGMTQELNRLIRRSTRWFLRNRRSGIEIQEAIRLCKPEIEKIQNNLENIKRNLEKQLSGPVATEVLEQHTVLVKQGVPDKLALKIAGLGPMFSVLDIIEAASVNHRMVEEVSEIYFAIGAGLKLDWFREQIKAQRITNNWEALARSSFRDDVDRQQRNIAISILENATQETSKPLDNASLVSDWFSDNEALLSRWFHLISELKSVKPEFTMFAVALRELLDLSQSITHQSKC